MSHMLHRDMVRPGGHRVRQRPLGGEGTRGSVEASHPPGVITTGAHLVTLHLL